MGEMGIPCIGIVVSEDETSKIMPDLPRQISLQALLGKQNEVEAMLGDAFNLEKSFDLIQWLEVHRLFITGAMQKANDFVMNHSQEL